MAHTRPPVWAVVASSLGLLLVAIAVFGLGQGAGRGPVDAARAVTDRVSSPRVVDPGAGSPDRNTPVTTTTAPPVDLVPQMIRIPSIGVTSPLIGLGLNADNTLQVPTDFGVAGWYIYRSVPGQPGPGVIAGHVDSRTGPAVFYRLKDLTLGATIEVERSDGTVAFFAVTGREQVDKDQFPTERVYGPTAAAELRLITCGGTFNWSTHHYDDNLIVYAMLQRIVP